MQENAALHTETDGVHIHLENKKIGAVFFWFVWMMYALVYMTKYSFSAVLAPIVEAGVLTKSQTGLIAASFHFVYAPLQIVGGIVADKYNPEKMIKIGLAGSAIVNLLIHFNHSYYFMLGAWMLNAAVQFALWPSVFKIVASQLPRSEKKKYAFYISFSSTFGLLLSYIVAAVLPSWEYNFSFSAAVLAVLFVAAHFACKKVDTFMLPDKIDPAETSDKKGGRTISNSTLMWGSGLILMVVAGFTRTTVGQGAQTLAPTMLLESYDNISASLGNALNVFIIFSGLLGTLAGEFMSRKIIKNEVLGFILLLALTLPLIITIRMVGVVTPLTVILSMCGISFLASAAQLLIFRYNLNFAPFGKDGFVAGLTNSISSAALIVQTYGLNVIAENFGWQAVSNLWLYMTVFSVILLIIALPQYKKFKKYDII